MKISPLRPEHTEALFVFEQENRDWFEQSVPARPQRYHELVTFRAVIDELLQAQAQGDCLLFVLEENDCIVGRANLVDISASGAEIGYRIGQSYAGQGLATLAVKHLLQVAKQDFNLEKVVASTTMNNLASRRVLEKSGFGVTKEETDAVVLNNEPLTMLHFECDLA
ncbi:hypothetical protein EA58_00145 [Photobacterium galatheae]|uniref:N-acetyltransferase domain-containing protein n=1 Tax=Photobacterium galatheae TaxID=1654360 RepID=A0A066S0P3_9GAMM|nr:hypothetical protein EA58_00145 [Photobacterium galatheae]